MKHKSEYKILMVDQDAEFLRVITKILRSDHFTVQTAESCQDAMALILTEKPDLILLSDGFPDEKGLDLCKKLKSNPDFSSIYIILTSDIQNLNKPGEVPEETIANEVIVKPFSVREIKSRVESAYFMNKIQADLHESEEKFMTVFKYSPVPMIISSASDFRFVDVNDIFIVESGYTRDEILGATSEELGVFVDYAQRQDWLSTIYKSRKVNGLEIKLKVKSGKILTCLISTRVINIEGSPHFISTLINMTERKAMEDMLFKREEDLDVTLHSIGDGVISTDSNGLIVRMNPVAEKLTGWPLNEAAGKHLQEVFRIIDSETREDVEEMVSKVIRTREIIGLSNHTVLIARDGKEHQIADSAAPIVNRAGEITGVVLVFSDVTDKYEIQAALQKSERDFRNLFENISEGVALHELVYDDQGRPVNYKILSVNPAFQANTGIDPEQVLQKLATVAYGVETPPYFNQYAKVAETGEPMSFEEYFQPLDKYFIISVSSPKKGQFVTVFQDITSRKNAELALKLSEEKFAVSFRSAHYGITISHPDDGRFIEVNDAFYDITGYSPHEVINHSSLALGVWADPKDREWVIGEISQGRKVEDKEFFLKKKNGTLILCEYSGHMISIDNQSFVWSSITDITAKKKIQNELILSEAKFRSTFDQSPVGSVIVNLNMEFVKCNQAFCAFMGYNESELIGRKVYSVTHPDDIEIGKKELMSMVKGEVESTTFQKRYIRKDGEIVWGELQISLVKDENNHPLYFLPIVQDITRRRQIEETLRESERMLRESQEVAKLGCFTWDIREGHWISTNILDGIFGIDQDYDRTLQGWVKIIHPDWQETMNNYVVNEVVGQLKDFDKEYMIVNQTTNETRWVHGLGRVEVDENGMPLKLVGTITDITRRKLDEEELIKSKEKAEQSDKLKSAFLANMSHEIRTPMNAIVGFAGMLTEPLLSDSERMKYSRIIQSRSDDLMHIINDLLDISRIESGNAIVYKEDLFINKVLDEVFAVFTQKMNRNNNSSVLLQVEKGISDPQFRIHTDGYILRQVYSNLIENALKFTNSGSVKFGYFPPAGQQIIFYVADTGIGISPENHEVIFEHFRQADIMDKHKYGGTGLGLSICKGSLNLLDGKIWVESQPGQGSTFYFTLPCLQFDSNEKPEPGQINSQTDAVDFNWKGKRILILEDDMTNMEFLKIILNETGADLNPVYTGQQLKACYPELDSYHLLLLDIRLPDASGWDLARQIKSLCPKLPVIAQTAYAMPSDKKKCEEAGCDDYISKPIAKSALLQMIANYL